MMGMGRRKYLIYPSFKLKFGISQERCKEGGGEIN